MKCNPLRWLWGLLPLAALVWLAFVWERGLIEDDLKTRTQDALAAAGLTWAGTAFDGRDGLLKGLAFKDEHPDQAADVARKVWGVRVVEEQVDLIDLVDDYTWAAESNAQSILLTGHVPSEEARGKLRKLIDTRFPGKAVDDRTKLARGAPALPAWMTAIGFGLDRLAQLKSGSLELNGLALSISGQANDFAAYKSASAALTSAVPEGVKINRNDIRPPIVSPYTWSVSRSATHLILSGHVPGEEERERLFILAKKEHPTLVIIDRMETGAGAPAGWEKTAATSVTQAARLDTGEANISDSKLTLKGKAPDEDTANAIMTEIGEAIPKAFTFTHDITFPEPKPPVISPFTTTLETVGDVVRLTGFVPDEAARRALLDAAGKVFPDKQIEDALSLGSGQPEGWRRCMLAGIEAAGRLGSGTATLSDKSLNISATTSNEELAAALPGDVRAATTRACDSQLALTLDLPPEPDLAWRANYDGNGKLLLDGQVPGIESLTLLLSAARTQFPKAEIDNRMRIASGYAAKWQKAATHGITLLRLLRHGEVTLEGQNLSVTGVAADTAAATAIKDRLAHNLPKGYTGSDDVEVKSDAMIWAEVEAKRKAEAEAAARLKAEEEAAARQQEDAAAARRKAQDQADSRRLLQELLSRRESQRLAAEKGDRGATPQAGVKTKLDELLARRAAQNSQRRAEEGLKAAAEAEAKRRAKEEAARREAEEEAARKAAAEAKKQAEAAAESETARSKAEAEAEAERRAEAEHAARRKAEEEAEDRRRAEAEKEEAIARDRRASNPDRSAIPEAAFDCQKRMSEAAKNGVILFDYASAELAPDSRPTLDQLASIANSCPDVALAVEGHTDSIGQRPDNRKLSLRRSEAVIDYLANAGINRSRLRAVGYGEEHPLVPNNSPANRARNRRIEFSIDVKG